MTRLVSLAECPDPRDAIHEAVERLAGGQLVGLPTETSYVVCGSGLNPDVGRSLSELTTDGPQPSAVLMLPVSEAARDFGPAPSLVGNRLMSRCWPGPLVITLADAAGGALEAVPEISRDLVTDARGLRLNVPQFPVMQEVLRLCRGPLIGLPIGGGDRVLTSADLARRAGERLSLIIDAGDVWYQHAASEVRISGNHWEMVQEGTYSRRAIAELASEIILFICTGNTCRSPMAEALFRKMLSERLECDPDRLVERGYFVTSAGVNAVPGMGAAPEGIAVLRERGVDLSGHTSRPVTETELRTADHIYTMTASHLQAVLNHHPDTRQRARLLSPENLDVPDPIGGGPEEYRQCHDEIARSLRVILEELQPTSAEGRET